MTDLLYLTTRGQYTHFLPGRGTETPRSYEWCIREALGSATAIDYLNYASHSFSPRAWCSNLRKIARAEGTIFCVGANLLIPAIKWAGHLQGRLVVLLWSIPQPTAFKRAMFQSQLNAAASLGVNDRETGRQLRQEWPALASKTIFVPFPVDTEFFHPPNVRYGDFILVPGDKDRDEELVLQMAELIDIPVVRVTREQRVKDFYKRHSYNSTRLKVMFRLSYPELRNLYQTAKAVVLPVMNPRHPAGLTSLLEAMACGCPCLVACGKTTADYVRNGETAILLDGGKKEVLQQICLALKTPDYLEEIGQNAYRHAMREFSIDHLAPAWRNFITS